MNLARRACSERAVHRSGRFSFRIQVDQNPGAARESSRLTIPAIADANSITYVLHKKVGDTIDVNGVKLLLVAALDDSIFQSELIVSEAISRARFREEQGFGYF